MLEQLARLIVPLALMMGLALLMKGHNEPGGGFVGGLSFAVAGILAVASYGPQVFRSRVPVAPERMALLGVAIMAANVLVPPLVGGAALEHTYGTLHLPLLGEWKWHTALVFDVGVLLAVSGGAVAAALWLWEQPGATRIDGEGGGR